MPKRGLSVSRTARDQVAATSTLSRRLEDLQPTAGEGPCLDAFASGVPVLVANTAAESARWLGFVPDALAAGAAAVFSLPLQVGAVRLGTLDLYRSRVARLSPLQLAAASCSRGGYRGGARRPLPGRRAHHRRS